MPKNIHSWEEAEAGRQLGFDLFSFGIKLQKDIWPSSVLEGWTHAKGINLAGQLPTRYEKKWLQLRLNALRRHRIVDPSVTPTLLFNIDVAKCPVLRCILTHGELAPTDWSIDRLNNAGAYAARNLAVMSTKANMAKSNLSFEEVYAFARGKEKVNGLEPAQWMRMASIMLGPCFSHTPQLEPILPLVAPIPSLTVRTATQQIQFAITLNTRKLAERNVLIKAFSPACRTERSKYCLELLTEDVHFGLKNLEYPWDVWLDLKIMNDFSTWRFQMSNQAWAQIGQIATRLTGMRSVSSLALQSWHTSTNGKFIDGAM